MDKENTKKNNNVLYDWDKSYNTLFTVLKEIFAEQADVKNREIMPALDQKKGKKIKDMEFVEEGKDPEYVAKMMLEHIYKYRAKQNHPQFFSFIPNAVTPLSIVGESINSAINPYGGSHNLSEGISLAEKSLINFMGSAIGYEKKPVGGIVVSGGSIANLTACVIARDEKLAEDDFVRGTVYISDQTHSSVAKGFRIMGILSKNIRMVATDDKYRMIPEKLEEMIEEDRKRGCRPFLIVGTAGTTNTGSVDPLPELAAIAKKYDMWFHVDGAYGASVLLSSYADELKGIELSDSVSWDGHKWLFQTYGCGVVICKDRQAMRRSFSANPEYLHDIATDDDRVNFWDVGIELTRPARGMKLWYTLQVMGLEAMRKAIDRGFEAAKYLEKKFRELDNFEIISPAQMSIVIVRYNDGSNNEELNRKNRLLSHLAAEGNKAIYYTTELEGKVVLRFCTIHPELTTEQMDKVIHKLVKDTKRL